MLRELVLWLCAVLPILAATGCDTDPTTTPLGTTETTEPMATSDRDLSAPGPLPASMPAFYPLDIGNRWRYQGLFHVQVLDDDGDVVEDLTFPSEFTREITGTEGVFGLEYVLEEENGVQHSPLREEPTTWTYWYRYRQDRSGLYEANVPITDPPGSHPVPGTASSASKLGVELSLAHVPERHRAAFHAALQQIEERRARLHAALGQAVVEPQGNFDELTRLRYPLHPGATWTILNDPDLVVRGIVEQQEVLELPAGRFPSWRVRILWEIPDTTVLVWYGSSGFLQLFAHLRGEATDENGNHIGWIVSDETAVLTSLQVAGQPVGRGPNPDPALKW